MLKLKDERLARISKQYNVAQFVSFAPDGTPRFDVTAETPQYENRASVGQLVGALLTQVDSVNIRTFSGDDSKSTDFVYGVRSVEQAIATVQKYSRAGLYTIVNETVDVHDGGVSGVAVGGVTEFAPDATPRVVEQLNDVVARLPSTIAHSVIKSVYDVSLHIPEDNGCRVEFSVHPLRVGNRNEHTLCWEVTEVDSTTLTVIPNWPNGFSQMLGDKVYGLLVADAFGLPVPRSTVISRRLAPFHFGRPTGSSECWIRTSPRIPQAGRFITARGWTDPFKLLEKEDPDSEIASVIAQEGISAAYSGGAATQQSGGPLIEGTSGYGDQFMLGGRSDRLPLDIKRDVERLLVTAQDVVGSAQIEWVHDGKRAWLVQLHARSLEGITPGVINPGNAAHWIRFDPDLGLDRLRKTIREALQVGAGIEVTRMVGVTSHIGDLIRKAGVPGRLA